MPLVGNKAARSALYRLGLIQALRSTRRKMISDNALAALAGFHRESQQLGGMRPKSFGVVCH